MRKIVLVLVAFALAAPAFGTVAITATDEGGGNVAINYDVTGTKVRAFALNITVDAGVIDDVCDYHVGESNNAAKGYGIFMGSINIDPVTGAVISYGSPVGVGPCALGGIGTTGITIEMGSLYEDGNAPPDIGTLCKIHVTAETCNLNVTAEDVCRGGVVLENGLTVAPDLSAFPVAIGECFPSDHPDYDEWVLMDRPECWCFPRQCRGDANGEKDGTLIKYWVSSVDLGILIANWLDAQGTDPAHLCADFNHKLDGTLIKYRTSSVDLGILIDNWLDAQGSPPDCLDVVP